MSLLLFVLFSLRRHHERDTSGEAVRLKDDRKQRTRDEGAAHGPGDGECAREGQKQSSTVRQATVGHISKSKSAHCWSC